MEAFVNQSMIEAGIVDASAPAQLLDVVNGSFFTYALNTSIGPISGGSQGDYGVGAFPTVGGGFEFTSPLNADHPATFTATLPEPGTLGLIGSGIGLLLIRRRDSKARN